MAEVEGARRGSMAVTYCCIWSHWPIFHAPAAAMGAISRRTCTTFKQTDQVRNFDIWLHLVQLPQAPGACSCDRRHLLPHLHTHNAVKLEMCYAVKRLM